MDKEISVNEAAKLRASSEAIFLDVREPNELSICSIENSLHIPMGEIPNRVEHLPKDKDLIVFCHHGMRSMQVVNFLQARGFENAINLGGGIHAWAIEQDPKMDKY
jgi:rhodanese-related sulfurtransferase